MRTFGGRDKCSRIGKVRSLCMVVQCTVEVFYPFWINISIENYPLSLVNFPLTLLVILQILMTTIYNEWYWYLKHVNT